MNVLQLSLMTASQKMKFSVKDFFSKCDQICSFLRVWSDLLKKSLEENIFFYAVNPQTASKTHWSVLKTFVNGTKVPVIPPLLENNKLVTDFKLKTNLFNGLFNQQCTTVDISSSVPKDISFETEKRLSTFEICNDGIFKFIRSLDPNKAHDQYGISIRMLKLCATSITKPLQILYKNCLDNKCFPKTWNDVIIPIHKKGDKQLKKKLSTHLATNISG